MFYFPSYRKIVIRGPHALDLMIPHNIQLMYRSRLWTYSKEFEFGKSYIPLRGNEGENRQIRYMGVEDVTK